MISWAILKSQAALLIKYGEPIPIGSAKSSDFIRLKSSKPLDEKHYRPYWENDTIMIAILE